MRIHSCQALGCIVATLRHQRVLCPRHWSALPVTYQVEMMSSYHPGHALQGVRYYDACATAIEFIARLENVPMPNRYRSIADRLRARVHDHQI